jgi:hypothetical protein
MMKNLKQSTEQLKELAKALNEFKSEAVQVKLIELLFGEGKEIVFDSPSPVKVNEEKPAPATVQQTAVDKTVSKRPGRPRKVKQAKVAAPAQQRTPRTRSTTRPGPSVILKTLIDTNFFSDNRTIGDVVDYCMKMFNYEYKSTDLSGTLAKLSKDGILRRDKNPQTNQFEYKKV